MVGIIVLIFAGLAYLVLATAHRQLHAQDIVLSSICAAILLPLVAVPLYFLIVYRIEADADGLRWRNLKGWHRVPWAKVTDYYRRFIDGSKRENDSLIVETVAGQLKVSAFWAGDVAGFRAAVASNASQARATGWQVAGTRLEIDGHHAFTYRTGDNRVRLVSSIAAISLGPVFATYLIWPRHPISVADPGFGYTIAMMAMAVVRPCVVSLMGFLALPSALDARRRQSEQVIVSTTGIESNVSGAADLVIRLPWSSIRRLTYVPGAGKLAPGRYRVEGDDGTVEFSPALGDLSVLLKIIQCRVTELPEAQRVWKYLGKDEEVLGGAAAKWTGGCEGVGERVFSYQNRTCRSMLWFVCLFAILPSATPGLRSLSTGEPMDAVAVGVCGFAGLIVIVWLVWRYRAGGVVVSADGLSERTPFGLRSVRWADMESYKMLYGDVASFGVVQASHRRRIRFWYAISDMTDLTRLITERAPQATGSWSKPDAFSMTDT